MPARVRGAEAGLHLDRFLTDDHEWVPALPTA